MMTIPSLRIIIVNWNSKEQTRACLQSLVSVARRDTFRFDQVVVVDNASSDGSADDLEAEFPSGSLPLQVIRNETNQGFAAACNQGAAGSTADYILLLNPDTIAYPDSLSAPIAFLEKPENREIGILGIKLIDEDGKVSRRCARFPTATSLIARSLGGDILLPRIFPSGFMKEWDHEDSREVDQVMGAFFLVRGTVWQALGGMDDQFFVYFEDLDFALRARQQGWKSYYWAGASLFHKGGGTTDQVKAVRLAYSLFSRVQFSRKHFGPLGAFGVTVAALFAEPATRFVRGLLRRSLVEIRETFRGITMLWKAVFLGSIRPTPVKPVKRATTG